MELGNIVFGNSRGEYSVPRTDKWLNHLIRLFDAIEPDRDNSYGIDYENDTFFLMPYYWGDCTCGYEEKEWEWCNNNQHEDTCYQRDYQKISAYNLWKNHDEWLNRYVKPLYEKYGIDTSKDKWWAGCAVLCTCSYESRWINFLTYNGHTVDCPIIKPNFLYKPIGFELQWYKYPLRDSYMNQKITVDEFSQIIDKCINSVREDA